MAAMTLNKPRTRSAMDKSTIPERVSVVETKVDNVIAHIDEIKTDIKEMHVVLDKNRESIMEQLKNMSDSAEKAHDSLGMKIGALEKFKDKWTYTSIGAAAVLGFASGHLSAIFKSLT